MLVSHAKDLVVADKMSDMKTALEVIMLSYFEVKEILKDKDEFINRFKSTEFYLTAWKDRHL